MTEIFYLKDENQKLKMALKLIEDKCSTTSRELATLKRESTQKEKELEKINVLQNQLEKQNLEEKTNSKKLQGQFDFKFEDQQSKIRQKDKEIFILNQKISNLESFSTFETEKAKLKNEYQSKFSAEIQILNAKLNSAENELKTRKKEIETIKNKLDDISKGEDSKIKEIRAKNKTKMDDLNSESEKSEVVILNLKSKLTDFEFEIQKLSNELKSKGDFMENQMGSLKVFVEKIKREKNELTVQLSIQTSNFKEENRKLKLENEKISIEKSFIENELKSKLNLFTESENEINRLKSEKRNNNEINEDLEKEIFKLKNELKSKVLRLEEIENQFLVENFKEKSNLLAKLEIEKTRFLQIEQKLKDSTEENIEKFKTCENQIGKLKTDLEVLKNKKEKLKLKKKELSEKLKKFEIENHKFLLTNASNAKSLSELEDALKKNKIEIDENNSIKKQAANLLLMQNKIDTLQEKFTKAKLKNKKLKNKIKSFENSNGFLENKYELENQNEFNPEQELLHGSGATRFYQETPFYFKSPETIDDNNGTWTVNPPCNSNENLRMQLNLQTNDFLEQTLPKNGPKITKNFEKRNEIRISDQQNSEDFSFRGKEPEKKNDGNNNNEEFLLMPKKDRLEQLLRSGELLFGKK